MTVVTQIKTYSVFGAFLVRSTLDQLDKSTDQLDERSTLLLAATVGYAVCVSAGPNKAAWLDDIALATAECVYDYYFADNDPSPDTKAQALAQTAQFFRQFKDELEQLYLAALELAHQPLHDQYVDYLAETYETFTAQIAAHPGVKANAPSPPFLDSF